MMASGAQPTGISLRTLIAGLVDDEVPDIALGSLSQTAQEVESGGLFLATAGASNHGLDFADEAVARGAVAVAWEPVAGRPDLSPPPGVTGIAIPNLRHLAGTIADRFFGEPSAHMQIAGITGTNGKTTSTFLVAQALESLGVPCAVMGTLGSGRPDALQASALTTPDAVTVHRHLAHSLNDQIRYLVMEVSSHALVQGRVNGVRMDCAAFTNLSRDHLDYHGDLDAYAEAKCRLFREHSPRTAVVNVADEWGQKMCAALPADSRRILIMPKHGETENEEWLTAADLRMRTTGVSFVVRGSFGEMQINSRLVGDFNVANLLLALGILLSWDIEFEKAVGALEKVRAPAGRMESFHSADGVLVIVDYAHTPDALEKLLVAARKHTTDRLIVVFGCGGERDRGKRAQMGRIAEQLAEQVIVTDDNPRNEDPDRIVADILSGMAESASVERDRAAAISSAVAAARPGDVVVVAGKGHEAFQTTAQGRRPFSDRAVVAELLASRSGADCS